jgi:hypothetical protein
MKPRRQGVPGRHDGASWGPRLGLATLSCTTVQPADATKEYAMRFAFAHQRHGRTPFRLVMPLTVACLLLAVGLIAAGCGGGSSSGTTATSATATSAASATMSGSDLGKAEGVLWAEAMQKLNALLDGTPSADAVKDKVAALKEEYVQKLVALGKQREALDASAKADADSAAASALAAAANETWYKAYMDYYDQYNYQSGDVDFVNLLSSFNILTQYADFELLKKQAPAEATRLGIQ